MKVMMQPSEVVTVQVPFRIAKRGGRKELVLPEGAAPRAVSAVNSLVKALARAFRWKKMIESGEFATIGDLAAHEKIAPTYMTRIMRLTLLAPETVEAMLEGRCEVELAQVLETFPVGWREQKWSALR